MLFEHQPISCDLSETALDDATLRMGMKLSQTHEMVLYTSRTNAKVARQLQAMIGMEVVLVPDAMLPSCYTWAIEWNGRLLGSSGPL